MSSTSVRKRASDAGYEESFVNPQFEGGRKNVPQAELEHVTPTKKMPDIEQNVSMQVQNFESVKKQVSEHLQKISESLNQIMDLASDIQLEKENIKRILKTYHE